MNSGRYTAVGSIKINAVSAASVVQFGDTRGPVRLFDRVLAIQRAIANFERDELTFESYPLFFLPSPVPATPPPVQYRSEAPKGRILVGPVRVNGVSNSCFIRAGNGGGPHIAESRIVNIRHFNDRYTLSGTSSDLLASAGEPE